jgi:flagellar motility protein MotE (MotC chaperone)
MPAPAPALVAVLGLVTGTATGVAWLWRAGESLAAAAASARAAASAAPAHSAEKAKGWDFWTIEIDNLASELKGEKERLRLAQEQVDQRAARLAAEERELARLRTDLERLRGEISQRVVEIDTDELKNLRSLAQTYSALTPRAAVAIVREMDDATVVKILALMKPDVVSPIFEEMSRTADGTGAGTLARRAAVLSEKLRLLRAAKPAAS